MGKAYCKNCNREVDYQIIPTTQQAHILDQRVSYESVEGRCCKCGSPVYPIEVCDTMMTKFYEAILGMMNAERLWCEQHRQNEYF